MDNDTEFDECFDVLSSSIYVVVGREQGKEPLPLTKRLTLIDAHAEYQRQLMDSVSTGWLDRIVRKKRPNYRIYIAEYNRLHRELNVVLDGEGEAYIHDMPALSGMVSSEQIQSLMDNWTKPFSLGHSLNNSSK